MTNPSHGALPKPPPNKALKLPDVQQRLAALGADPLGGSAAEFGTYIKSEIAKYTKVVVDGKLQPQ